MDINTSLFIMMVLENIYVLLWYKVWDILLIKSCPIVIRHIIHENTVNILYITQFTYNNLPQTSSPFF